MEKESDAEGKTENETISKMKKNPWMVSTVILGIISIVLVVMVLRGSPTGNVISENTAGEKLVDYLNSLTSGGVTLVGVKDQGSLYEVTVSYQERDIPVYITKDGEYFTSQLTPITANVIQPGETPTGTPAEVPKSDKPKVEAFVFSYCPYGLQFEKALLPVYKILKNSADINIVAIGAMHGEYEKQETLRQLCIQKNYGKDKLWDYLEKFMVDTAIGNCNGDEACVNPLIERIFTQLGIDKNKINSCMKTDAESLYNQDVARANELGISGSPGFVINGVEVQVARNPESIKAAICDAFNTAPTECSQTLSTASTSAGFGSSASSGSSSGSC